MPSQADRGEPGASKGRRHFRPWQDGVIDAELLDGTMGGALGDEDLRVLGKPAVALWRYLLGVRGYAARWRPVAMADACEATRLPARTAKRALARLRDCGLARTELRRDRVPADTKTGKPSRWVATLNVLVFGAVDMIKGQEVMWAPDSTLSWCDVQPGWGGHRWDGREVKLAPSSLDWVPEVAHLGGQVGPPLITLTTTYPSATSLNREVATAGQSRAVGTFSSSGGKMQPMDKPTTRQQLVLVIKPDDSIDTQVHLLVRAYNEAAMVVYGVKGKAFLPRDPSKSKQFPRLRDAAAACVEHGVAPGAWAVWALQQSKAAQERRGEAQKPPHILGVFTASYIAKRRGWFRKTSEHQYGHVFKVDRVHLEQLYRRQEISKLGRGFAPDSALMFLPSWYVAIRRQEIADGYADPSTLYPRATTKAA
jgi:hypothetical protein